MGGIELIAKILGFGVDIVSGIFSKKKMLKDQFDKFFKRTGEEAKQSSDMHKSYKKMRDEEWKK